MGNCVLSGLSRIEMIILGILSVDIFSLQGLLISCKHPLMASMEKLLAAEIGME